MINGVNSNVSKLSDIYNSTGSELAAVMQQIASGKKFTQPSDNYVSFLQSAVLQNDVNNYTVVNGNIAQAKVYTDAGTKAGNQIYADLTSLQNLNTEWGATADATQKATLSTQFDALANQIAQEITSATYDGKSLIQAGNLTNVNLDTTATDQLQVTPTAAPASTDLTSLVGQIGQGATNTALGTSAAPGTILQSMSTYLSDMNSFGATLTSQTNLNNTIIASANSAITAVSGIDEATALTQETDLQVRQQAAVSMMSQANISQYYVARLFGGGSSG
jgi:flagellin-like hook-associated protein FlgL